MNISDNFRGYFNAVISTSTLTSQRGVEKHIRDNPQQFFYGYAAYSDYESEHTREGSLQRKIVAIPSALVAGVIKTIYHLTRAIFYGILTACMGEGAHFKADIYCFARDIEEALGWMLTIFNDKRGSYLVQKSLFQKECYSYFERQIMQKQGFSGYGWIDGSPIPHDHEAQRINLKSFYEMDQLQQTETITKFDLQGDIEEMGEGVFFQGLANADQRLLEFISLIDLKMDFERSSMKYAFMDGQAFRALTLQDIKDAPAWQMKIISERLKDLGEGVLLNEIPRGDILRTPVNRVTELSAAEIVVSIHQIPANIFPLFSDAQIQQIDFTQASVGQLEQLFGGIDIAEAGRRFALLSLNQVQPILARLEGYQLRLISDDQLQGLDLTGLSKEKLETLFRYINGVEERRRFALLLTEKVQSILDKLGEYQLRLISDNQLQGLDLTVLSKGKIEILFRYINGVEEYRRFALLSVEKVQSILDKLGEYQLRLISDEQLQGLDLTGLSKGKIEILFRYINGVEEYRRFALLSIGQVQPILDKLGDYQLSLISDNQLQELDLTGLSKQKLETLFRYINGVKERARFALLSVEKVQSILDKLGEYQLSLISDNQLQGLDLTVLSKGKIEILFRYIDGVKERARFALLSIGQVQSILNKLGDYQLSLISDGQLQGLNLTVLSKQKLETLFRYIDGVKERARFALLSTEQVVAIFDNLSSYHVGLISADMRQQLIAQNASFSNRLNGGLRHVVSQ